MRSRWLVLACCALLACGDDGDGSKSYIGLFDTDQDCSVSTSEVKTNSLIVSLFAPDVVIDGQQAVSIGFGFAAVPGAFTP